MNKELINIAKKLRNTLTKEDIDKIYENIQLKSEKQEEAFYIHWNSWWMLYLVIFLLDIVKKENRDHFHFDQFNGMERDSIELIFEKYDK